MELRDRRHLANHGLVLVFLALNQSTGEIVSGPELVTRGFVLEAEGQPLMDEALALVRATLFRAQPRSGRRLGGAAGRGAQDSAIASSTAPWTGDR